MCEMYGYKYAEARQLTVEDLSSGETFYTQADAIQWIQRAAKGKPQLFEWRAKNKSGE